MQIRRVLVLGAGTVGTEVAQIVAQSGFEVVLRDIKEEQVKKSLRTIVKNLQKLVNRGKLSDEEREVVLNRITGVTDIIEGQDADLVIEAVNEDLSLKKEVFTRLGLYMKKDAIFATGTSALPVAEMAAAAGRPDRFVGIHFFAPVSRMRLAEIVRGTATSDETFNTIKNFLQRLGKIPVIISEAAGSAVNRILISMINEAAYILMERAATAADIDRAMRLGANHPIGPLALGDLIGLDVCLAVLEALEKESGDSKYRACPLLRKNVRAGFLGRKTGKGFFVYSGDNLSQV